MSSEVPEERRAGINFSFSSQSPTAYDVSVSYKSRHIATISLNLDELLEKQQNNELELEAEFLKLNVNLLIYLLRKQFLGGN